VTTILLLAFLIGVIDGLRSMTAPAAVCWAAHLGWLHLEGTHFSFLASRAALVIFTLGALGELVADKLPFVPARTTAGPLIVRVLLGALCGAALTVAGSGSLVVGALLGGMGAVCGAFAGYHVRHWLVVVQKSPDLVIALLEDVVAVGGGFLIVSRF
jgi:uncharacterized membrane protein